MKCDNCGEDDALPKPGHCWRCGKPLPDQAPIYMAPWSERANEMRRYWILLGTLIGISGQVEPELQKRIEAALREVEALKEEMLCSQS